MEKYIYCINEDLCRKIQISFNLKSSAIKKFLFSEVIQNMCKKIDTLKEKKEKECEISKIEILKLEKMVLDKTAELLQTKEKVKITDQSFKEKIEMEISKYKEKVI